jgi:hypothetical protein
LQIRTRRHRAHRDRQRHDDLAGAGQVSLRVSSTKPDDKGVRIDGEAIAHFSIGNISS